MTQQWHNTEDFIPVRCPCCGAEFFFPPLHPIHNRLQYSLDLSFEEVEVIHKDGLVEKIRLAHPEVPDEDELFPPEDSPHVSPK